MDILLGIDNNSYDLQIKNGDFVVGESTDQEVVLLINTWIGSWKKYPLVGVGIINYLKSSEIEQLRRNIGIQLEGDKIIIDEFSINPNDFTDITLTGHRP